MFHDFGDTLCLPPVSKSSDDSIAAHPWLCKGALQLHRDLATAGPLNPEDNPAHP